MRSYEKRLVTVMGMDAARARTVVHDDLDIGAKVTNLARQAVRDAGPAMSAVAPGPARGVPAQAPPPPPVAAATARSQVRTLTGAVLRDLGKMQAPKGRMRQFEEAAHDDAPMMGAKRRQDREDRDMDGPSL